MRRVFISGVFGLLFLSACTGGSTARYRIEVDDVAMAQAPTGTGAVAGDTRQSDLLAAAKRGVERRLALFETEAPQVRFQAGNPVLVVEGISRETKTALAEQLTAPFSLKFMKQVETGATLTIEGHGGFVETGIDGRHVRWVTADSDYLTGKGVVGISFTREGVAALRRLFAENPGRSIGIFVRDKLVSKRTLSAAEKDTIEMISIADVPTPEIAAIFADDVNVGLHVVFVPLD